MEAAAAEAAGYFHNAYYTTKFSKKQEETKKFAKNLHFFGFL